jgi:PKD repeat protein
MRRGCRVGVALLVCVSLGWLLGGCFGPLERPAADFVSCAEGDEGQLDYWFSSASIPIPGAAIVDVEWDFGDGTPSVHSEGGDVLHRFPAEGEYRVCLTVTDSRGVAGTITKPMNVALAAFVHSTWTLTLGYPPTVRGIVENRSDRTLRSVVVRARFYDADEVRISDERQEILDLDPGEKAAFEIQATGQLARIFYAAVDVASFESDCRAAVYGAGLP